MQIHPVFEKLDMQVLTSQNLDSVLACEGLKILFLWGLNCPNCEVAKKSIFQEIELFRSQDFAWYHCNLYEDFAVGTHFGVHGIPVFFVYDGPRRIGRITSFPGVDPFIEALQKVRSLR